MLFRNEENLHMAVHPLHSCRHRHSRAEVRNAGGNLRDVSRWIFRRPFRIYCLPVAGVGAIKSSGFNRIELNATVTAFR